MSERVQLYNRPSYGAEQSVLTRVRLVMIQKMSRPKEVMIVEDEARPSPPRVTLSCLRV